MTLITNKKITCKKDVMKIVRSYLSRWKIEQNFKFKKQEYKLEKIKVLKYNRIVAMNKLLSAVSGLIAFYQFNQMLVGNKYITDRYTVIPECPAGEGIADMVIIPKKEEDLPIIIEFKVNKSVDEAINQIKDRNYMAAVKGYNKILLVGINFNSETDKVLDKYNCKIEEYNR